MVIPILPPRPPAPPALRAAYQSRVGNGTIHADAAQEAALDTLQQFADGLLTSGRKFPFWSKGPSSERQGLYLYGPVGRGKTMLMDMLMAAVPGVPQRRVHFHAFMLEIHERLYQLQVEVRQSGHAMDKLAQQIASDIRLLCFDEFQVDNIADAMILGRLFEALFAAGIQIVATSNWPPDLLYKDGLQRERFLPFIDLIKRRMVVHELAGTVDHRLEYTRSLQNYLTPLGDITTQLLDVMFHDLTGGASPGALMLPVQGRTLMVRRCAKGVAFFTFEELCAQPLSAADYLALAQNFHTLVLDGVPLLRSEQRNEALRFIALIDVLYEAKIQLFIGAAASADQLYAMGDHAFSFQRTASRLMEMQSVDYRKCGAVIVSDQSK
jgi:cell division protein ZapE